MSRENFSEFTVEEQRIGLALEGRHTAHTKREAELTAAAKAAQQRLDAKPFFEEIGRLPGLEASFVAQFGVTLDQYCQKQETALALAKVGLGEVKIEGRALSAELMAHGNVVHAIRTYRDEQRAEPTIDPDMPPPDQLNSGIYDYEKILQAELETTRQLLSERAPELLNRWEFRVAQESIEFGGGGQSVGRAADELRAAREKLARLRAQFAN